MYSRVYPLYIPVFIPGGIFYSTACLHKNIMLAPFLYTSYNTFLKNKLSPILHTMGTLMVSLVKNHQLFLTCVIWVLWPHIPYVSSLLSMKNVGMRMHGFAMSIFNCASSYMSSKFKIKQYQTKNILNHMYTIHKNIFWSCLIMDLHYHLRRDSSWTLLLTTP